jgi:hypothetical protein
MEDVDGDTDLARRLVEEAGDGTRSDGTGDGA